MAKQQTTNGKDPYKDKEKFQAKLRESAQKMADRGYSREEIQAFVDQKKEQWITKYQPDSRREKLTGPEFFGHSQMMKESCGGTGSKTTKEENALHMRK